MSRIPSSRPIATTPATNAALVINWVVIEPDQLASLPTKSSEYYLVTVLTDDGREVHVLEYNGHGKWTHEGEYTFQHGYFFRPVAWATRPAPFAGSIPEDDL